MKIFFNDGTSINIVFNESILKNYVKDCFKHLQHIDIPFRERDHGGFLEKTNILSQVDYLIECGNKLSVEVDKQKCLSSDQSYRNFLHSIYEKNYDGNPIWLDFHETIHLLEDLDCQKECPSFKIDYRETAGLLETKFQSGYRSEFVTKVKAGEVYVKWAELSKKPWAYWLDQEPDDIERICELCKPWIHLRPQLTISLKDQDFIQQELGKKNLDEFLSWWEPYEKTWCNHWNLDKWTWQDMFSVIPVGHVENIDTLISADKNGALVESIKLNDAPYHKESLHFQLEIKTTWTTHAPSLEIYIDNQSIKIPHLQRGINKIEFNIELQFGQHTLKIKRDGATVDDNSQLAEIQSISIDQIKCDQLILHNSEFRPIYPEPWATEQKKQNIDLMEKIPYETVLGHNGEWTMTFSSPFYPHVSKFHCKPLHI